MILNSDFTGIPWGAFLTSCNHPNSDPLLRNPGKTDGQPAVGALPPTPGLELKDQLL